MFLFLKGLKDTKNSSWLCYHNHIPLYTLDSARGPRRDELMSEKPKWWRLCWLSHFSNDFILYSWNWSPWFLSPFVLVLSSSSHLLQWFIRFGLFSPTKKFSHIMPQTLWLHRAHYSAQGWHTIMDKIRHEEEWPGFQARALGFTL
jgi:hypothetical protein